MNLMGSSVKPIAVGGTPAAEVDQLARSLGCDRYDDHRKMSIDRPAAYLLLLNRGELTLQDFEVFASQGTTVLTLDPMASDLQELSALSQLSTDTGEPGRFVHIPLFSQSPGYLATADPTELLGDRRLVNFISDGRPAHGSLFARLFDAWLAVLSFTLMPEMIDASLVGPTDDTPDDLRELTGILAAHARVSDAQSALIEVSDTAAHTARSLRVHGDSATLLVCDTSYKLLKADGETLDDMAGKDQPDGFADLLAFQWRRILDQPAVIRPAVPNERLAEALACCLACHLSIRTGQPESPAKLLQLNR
ncbi:MAG: hypothetical protein Kow00105_03400 [Phycisphaeraceae bacterium]